MTGTETLEKYVVVEMPGENRNVPSKPAEKLRKKASSMSHRPSVVPLPILKGSSCEIKNSQVVTTPTLQTAQCSQVESPSEFEISFLETGFPNQDTKPPGVHAFKEIPAQNGKNDAVQESSISTQPDESSKFLPSNDIFSQANATLSTQFAAIQEYIQTLVQRLNEAEASLHEAHETIFSLQPYRQSITESEAATEFASLIDSIQSWIFNHLGDALDDRRMLNNGNMDFPEASRLISLLTPAGREAMQYPTTDEWNITAVIMRFLDHEVFKRELCGVVPTDQLQFLHGIERSMACLEPRRDLTTTRTWLATTLHALTSTPNFPSLLPPRIKVLATSLAKILRLFSPNPKVTPPLELRAGILVSIIEPAVALAYRLHLSPNFYTTDFSPYAMKYEESRMLQLPPIERELSSFEALDIMRAGKNVRAEDFAGRNESERTKDVTYVMDLCPGLFVQTVKGDVIAERRVLKKPKVVVAVTETGKKANEDGSFPPPFQEGEEGTLVAYLYNRVVERQTQQAEKERVRLGWIKR